MQVQSLPVALAKNDCLCLTLQLQCLQAAPLDSRHGQLEAARLSPHMTKKPYHQSCLQCSVSSIGALLDAGRAVLGWFLMFGHPLSSRQFQLAMSPCTAGVPSLLTSLPLVHVCLVMFHFFFYVTVWESIFKSCENTCALKINFSIRFFCVKTFSTLQ